MKQPIIKCSSPVEYKFNRLSPIGYNVKDSCSFSWFGMDYIICTDVGVGGLVVFKKTDSYIFHQRLFPGWTAMWAPFVLEWNGGLYIFCSDTGGAEPWWLTQRIKYFSYNPVSMSHSGLSDIDMGHNFGVIDPEIFRIGNKFIIAYTIMDWWNRMEWWDNYCSEATSPLGPYSNCQNITGCIEHGQEEAFHFNKYDGLCYWSVMNSDENAEIRRGTPTWLNGHFDVIEDTQFKMKAAGSVTCTHPDSWNGKIMATLKDGLGFYIAEMEC